MKQKQIVIILIPMLILTVFWVIFNVYHNHTASTITDPLSYQIIPIQGNFDQETISQVLERNRVNPSNEITQEASLTPTPELEDEDAIDSSQSAEIELDDEELTEDEDENL